MTSLSSNESNLVQTYTDKSLYSDTQLKILFALPILPSLLSAICSGLILNIIFSDAKRKLKHVYHRVLVGFSIIDILSSMVYAASSLPVPKGSPGTFGARGNWTTCNISGFLIQFNFSKAPYWAFLCLQYALVIRYSVRQEKIVKFERIVHVFAFLAPFSLGIAMLQLNNYNPTYINPGTCFLNCYPASCLRDEGVECERGKNYFVWSVINFGVLIISLQVGFFSLVTTCRSVKRTQIRQSRWTVSSSSDLLPIGVENTDPRSSTQSAPNKSLRRGLSSSSLWSSSFRLSGINSNVANNNNLILSETTRQVSIQTTLYIVSYFLVLIPYFVLVLSRWVLDGVQENRQYYFFLTSVVRFSTPSTGIWNFLVYCRPRLLSLRKQNPDYSVLRLLRHIVLHSKCESTPMPAQRPNLCLQPSPILESAPADESTTRRMNGEIVEREITPELDIHYPKCESESMDSNHDESSSYASETDSVDQSHYNDSSGL
jgi:hypothetical protein